MLKISRPTLLLNEKVAKNNIHKMAAKAAENNIPLRPHFKTHVSAEIGEWFREVGVTTCTVSSVEMAEYFVEAGWQDITIAFPFNRREIEALNQLATKCVINLVIEDQETLTYLSKALTSKVNYLIKTDVGTHRTGLKVTTDFSSLIIKSGLLNFMGFLVHAGHAYRCRSKEEIRVEYEKVSKQLAILKKHYPDSHISYGDTPTCSVINEFKYIDEIRAGNFVFYDWMQKEISACNFEDIAVCMAVPVVAKHEDRNEIVIHGGAIHFSKDTVSNQKGENIFGVLVKLRDNGWEPMEKTHYLRKVSQEHGILKITDQEDFKNIQIGDLVGVIPVHSCLAANLMGKYMTLSGQEVFHMNWRRK